MGKIYNDISELIGDTPLVSFSRLQKSNEISARLLAKIEYLNPAGSIKDRTALGIIRYAERGGKIKPGDLLVDLTSGNTGIGIAAIATAKGYRTKFYLRDTISEDKINILRQFGSEIVLIDNDELLEPGVLQRVLDRIRSENPDAYYTGQRSNPANPAIHFETTGPEIWRDTDGAVDILVSTVGTGGTISGTGRYLKEKKSSLRVILVEPTADSVPSIDNPRVETIEGVHKVTDIEENVLPENYDRTVVDEIIAVTTEQSRRAAVSVAREEGFLVGTSSGAAIAAALQVAKRQENAGKTIVAVLPDSGERYLSLFQSSAIAE
ncbi:PLP-dependent cysteine synthase family protein [Brucella sp. ZJ1_1]|uniref:Cysteine synthase A n=4 Tax=Brucella intermedia TaxID=94625 RepID=A0ABR6ATZ0_9HYPH|nr:PLP-dependent cysteine synthase family protein [Brucella intermedia]EEQ94542.1 Pyridoxal-phosphate dependent domain protein [Brucella intermedia LMG 3301]ELT49207.1 cysteine synthase [Brucella intermedia M86]KAB2707439.1 PLP-dependent cysteine synthase family protein [Brucella intermedia]MBA8852842.1 cysteine synthase A [Brucella intermedia]MCO7738450.1 PLP-dependent cysteine synthase family protein [Brucella intermedia]